MTKIIAIKLEKANKVLEEIVDRYVRNDIDQLYYAALAKTAKHNSTERNNYIKSQLTAENNNIENMITIDSTLRIITKYENELKGKKPVTKKKHGTKKN